MDEKYILKFFYFLKLKTSTYTFLLTYTIHLYTLHITHYKVQSTHKYIKKQLFYKKIKDIKE